MSVFQRPQYTFVLKLSDDRPGGMELIAATFAHRGVSLTISLGNDGALSPDACAMVLVTFTATPAKKEAIKGALSRLSRVLSVEEYASNDAGVRKAALAWLAPGAPAPALSVGSVERVGENAETGETLYALLGRPEEVDEALRTAQAAGHLPRGVIQTTLAL